MITTAASKVVVLRDTNLFASYAFGVAVPLLPEVVDLHAKALDEEGWVMHCSSVSKSLAPGYRLGWTAAGRFARRVETLKLSSTLSVAIPSQLAVLEYLRQGATTSTCAACARR